MLIRWTTSLMIVSGTNCKNPVEKQRGAIDHEGNQESGGNQELGAGASRSAPPDISYPFTPFPSIPNVLRS